MDVRYCAYVTDRIWFTAQLPLWEILVDPFFWPGLFEAITKGRAVLPVSDEMFCELVYDKNRTTYAIQ
jgi:hypothetical protein